MPLKVIIDFGEAISNENKDYENLLERFFIRIEEFSSDLQIYGINADAVENGTLSSASVCTDKKVVGTVPYISPEMFLYGETAH